MFYVIESDYTLLDKKSLYLLSKKNQQVLYNYKYILVVYECGSMYLYVKHKKLVILFECRVILVLR